MSAVDELVTWLRAALDDDDRNGQHSLNEVLGTRLEHDARFRLAEVEAKRRILAMYEDACDRVRNPVSADARAAARVAQFELEQVIKALAQPYAGQPGWREEWQLGEDA